MSISKRHLALVAGGIASAGAAAALTLGGTSALYTSGADSQSNSITSGTIALTQDTAKSVALNVNGFMPGDTTPTSKYYLTYAGNDAFAGVDLKITSTAQKACAFFNGGQASITPASLLAHCTDTGTVPMFDGDATSGSLDLSILPQNGDTAHQLFNPGDLEPGTTCSADATGLVTCTVQKTNVILPSHSFATPSAADSLVWHNGTVDWVTVKAGLPLAAPNIFQGSNVVIDLTAHAVQYANNNGPVASATTTTLPNGINGVGVQSAVLFPLSW